MPLKTLTRFQPNNPFRMPPLTRAISCLLLAWAGAEERAWANPDLKFDVATLCCPCTTEKHLCQSQLDHLNFPSTNGHYLASGSDTYRLQLATNGNALAVYYNNFGVDYPTNAIGEAATIDQYTMRLFTSTGPRPDWVVLNEISTDDWLNSSAYRTWVHDVVHALKNTYGYSVIVYSPLVTVSGNGADWLAVAQDAYIGIENYLTGSAVEGQNYSVSWCQSQYQASLTSYMNLGVARSRLMLGEEFTQTTSGTGYGRNGVSSNSWDKVIVTRNQGAQNVGFSGFLSYAWSGNAMLVSDDELLEHEDTYRTNQLPVNSGITAPFIVFQPQSQTAPSGATVGFIVFRAGTAPTTYQWHLEGTNLPGATTSALAITNIQPANAGNYNVVLSNAAGTVVSSNALLLVQVPPPLAFDPFADATASNGTSYADGAALIGQTNATGRYWLEAGPLTGAALAIASGSLSYSGLAASQANKVAFGGNGQGARFPLGSPVTSGTLYYSFLLNVTNTASLGTGNALWAGFNNSVGSQTTFPGVLGTRFYTKTNSLLGGFLIGLQNNGGGIVYEDTNTVHHLANETIFIVGGYEIINGLSGTDDISRMWINPAPSTLGSYASPAATLTITGGDIGGNPAQIGSFALMNRTAITMYGYIDELRVGASWASVTPPSAPCTLTIDGVSLNNVTGCYGGNNGSLTVSISGGVSPLQFSDDGGSSWNSGASPYTFNNLAAGSYAIQVRDFNLCTTSYSGNPVNITQPPAVTISGVTSNNVNCNGGSDGSISVSASGGTGALQYSKDNGANWQSGATFSSLGAGGYTIQVKDDNGCTVAYASNPVNLTQPTALTASAAADTTICSGASYSLNGSASGGSGGYTYSWSPVTGLNNANIANPTGSPATNTTYTLTVTDWLGCTAQAQVTVTVISPPSLSAALADTNVVLSWPPLGAYAGFSLQQNSNLTTANWVSVTNTVGSTNGTNQVTVPVNDKNFFRLKGP